ncbi:RDD family protein [Streptosporangium sp. NPDC049046]|uniref:RDD family protein n=1 Tax=unclassified Streptosporangium TaxID=2632669 RepID=UPI00342597EE
MGSLPPPPDDRGSDPWSDPEPLRPGHEGSNPASGPGHDPRPGQGPGFGSDLGPGHGREHGRGFDPVFGYTAEGYPPGDFPPSDAMRLGGRWRRLFAGILDLLIVGLISSPFTYRTVNTVTGAASGLSVQVPYAETFLVTVIGFLYYWLLTAYWNGQTLGKKIFRLRVTDTEGRRAGVGQVALRELVSWLMYSTCCLGWIDVAFILFHPRKQAVHDLAAKTLVIDA